MDDELDISPEDVAELEELAFNAERDHIVDWLGDDQGIMMVLKSDDAVALIDTMRHVNEEGCENCAYWAAMQIDHILGSLDQMLVQRGLLPPREG